MFKRLLTNTLLKCTDSFSLVILTGPRQSGKTTILRTLLSDYAYTSLESPDALLEAKNDPRAFLERHKKIIIDEVQNFPELFSYLQEYIDQSDEYKFVLSGSQNILLLEKISQTLAGRGAILELLPLTYQEYLSYKTLPAVTLWEYLHSGGYPRPYHRGLDHKIWYNGYIRTYLERDVRSVINVKNLNQFQMFLKLCAGRHGQLLNMHSLSQDCGISHTTASQWLRILETSYIVYRLQPYYRNFKKRLVKTPKLYFYDSAIVCHLLGIESASHLQQHVARGAIFEGYVISEIVKTYFSKGQIAPIYFWRDHTGNEVDLLIEKNGELTAVEIKSSKTLQKGVVKSLLQWQKISGTTKEQSYLIYAGENNSELAGIKIKGWKDCIDL